MAEKASLEGLRIDRGTASETAAGRRVWIPIAVVLFLVAAGLVAWLRLPRPAEVRVAAVREQPGGASVGAVLNASGYVTARRQATVSSKVTGKVLDVLVEEGDQVEAGQPVAHLDDATVRKEMALAEAQLSSQRRSLAETEVRLREARLNQGRARRLKDQGISTQADLDAAEAQVDSLAARLEVGRQEVEVAGRQVALRRQGLDDTVIRSPFAGVVVTKDAQPGEMISPVSAGGGFTRTGICTVVDMSSLEIEVDVNESYIHRVRRGQKATATLDAYPDWQIPARVIMPVPTADRQKATVRVRLAFDQLEPRILPDMGVKVAFLSDEEAGGADGGRPARPAVMVPRKAVRKDEDKDVVFVVVGDHVERRAIGLADNPGDDAVVLSGLRAGEQVVIDGPADLADGAKVAVLQ